MYVKCLCVVKECPIPPTNSIFIQWIFLFAIGKPANKTEEAKSKYIRTTTKVHNLHNEYVSSLREVNIHQKHYLRTLLPTLLDFQQEAQEDMVLQWCVVTTSITSSTVINVLRYTVKKYIYDYTYNLLYPVDLHKFMALIDIIHVHVHVSLLMPAWYSQWYFIFSKLYACC